MAKKASAPKGPLLGAHMSIAGGVDKALLLGKEVGCDTVQIFTKSSRQWASKPLSKAEIAAFQATKRTTGFPIIVAHDSYLYNFAASDEVLRKKSVNGLIDEMERCEALGVAYLIAHPGAHVGAGEAAGIATIAKSIDEMHKACPGYTTKLAIEITAGQGSTLGYRFQQVQQIIDATQAPERLRVCFDTEHAFAAGYDLRTAEGYERTFVEFEELIGIRLLVAFHLNDAKKDLGCRVDRHEHIGKGFLGLAAFRLLLNDRRFWGLPMCLETPKSDDCHEDRENLATLRGLLAA
ncbi:MAG: deoxyribonuclease IV [Deltaproteobacteria bacterium]|nr:deoxyribonuclease IV [Deltaproteobacteria bacterium]